MVAISGAGVLGLGFEVRVRRIIRVRVGVKVTGMDYGGGMQGVGARVRELG